MLVTAGMFVKSFTDSPDHKFLTPIPGAIAAMGSILKLSPEITVHIISNSNDTPIQLNSRLYNLMDYFPKTILKSAWFLQAGRRKLDFAKSILPNSIDIFTSLLIDDQEYQLNMWEKGGGLALRFENWDSAEIILRDSYGLVV